MSEHETDQAAEPGKASQWRRKRRRARQGSPELAQLLSMLAAFGGPRANPPGASPLIGASVMLMRWFIETRLDFFETITEAEKRALDRLETMGLGNDAIAGLMRAFMQSAAEGDDDEEDSYDDDDDDEEEGESENVR